MQIVGEIIQIVVFGTFFVAGFAIGVRALHEVALAWKCHDWPTTHGEILSLRWQYGRITFPVIEYRYWVLGTEHRGQRLNFSGVVPGVGLTRKYVDAKYRVGKQIRVRYCPQQPNEAYLDPKTSWSELMGELLILGPLLILFGAMFLWSVLE